ncbi:DUF3800 domain-containing protein [Frigoribacterium faeni]|uniref:DUF3800 domain-containing protein n=1 Tax=Frigoribacterium faeni TaxID=145483 RepID=UPI001FAD20A0|nr:DUF3800 domain-containing protein [Frigoribacterium faeni]MCJ0700252.1 DUF3800 domain-containing protein [Frigoribacterium faeni]
MLLAYIDEIGETGAFVGRDHARYKTSPAFGYAGFIIPENKARYFGALFQSAKAELFKKELSEADHPGRWEKKGSDVFRPDTRTRYPAQLRVFDSLVSQVVKSGGNLFYYADQKPIGTPKQVASLGNTEPADRETTAMQETLNRIARHAYTRKSNVMVVIDQINEKTRAERLPRMYSHILGRASDHSEMRRIIEPPMHVDSKLSANIQFADWVAACVTRAIDYQLLDPSPYGWVTEPAALPTARNSFTYESKLHLWQSSIKDPNNADIFSPDRVAHPAGGALASNMQGEAPPWEAMKAAAARQSARR